MYPRAVCWTQCACPKHDVVCELRISAAKFISTLIEMNLKYFYAVDSAAHRNRKSENRIESVPRRANDVIRIHSVLVR